MNDHTDAQAVFDKANAEAIRDMAVVGAVLALLAVIAAIGVWL